MDKLAIRQMDRWTRCGHLTSGHSFRDGAQLYYVHRAVSQVLAAVPHLSSSPPRSLHLLLFSYRLHGTQRSGSPRRGSCQKDSDPLASLSLCLARRSLSGSIKAAFWKLIGKGGTGVGGVVDLEQRQQQQRGERERREGEERGQGGVMRECNSE